MILDSRRKFYSITLPASSPSSQIYSLWHKVYFTADKDIFMTLLTLVLIP